MAAGWSVMDALNKNSKAAAEDKPKARFRTRDISIKKMYSNEKNFYSMADIEKLAGEILAVGMIENMTVVYAPCEKGEYRIIAGERRWRALNILVQNGHEEFEIATCQIKTPAEEHEETVQLIVANAYRNKTIADVMEEERCLKESLQYMRDNGLTLQGFRLDSGRLRDVIAEIMNTTKTKIAQIESINNRLLPELAQELKEGRLTFSAAYELSGMLEEDQQKMLEKHKESPLTWKDVREAKQQENEEADPDPAEDQEGPERDEPEGPDQGEEWQQAHPEGITSICYSCTEYETCNVKTGTCTKCDKYRNREEAYKTDEQRYNEEQDAIDRETKKKLQEMQEEQEAEERQQAAGQKKERTIRVSAEMMENIKTGKVPYMIVKQDQEPYREKDILNLLAFSEGRTTGETLRVCVTCADDSQTSSAIVEGYAVIGVMDVYDAENMGLIDLGDDD